MKKPTKKIIQYYDYFECREYINKKYKVDIDDYKGYFKRNNAKSVVGIDDSKPYCDFWKWLINNKYIHNDCMFSLSRNDIFDESTDEIIDEDWVIEIIYMFCDEFGKEIDFHVWW